jgi:hypothetical protein
MSAPTITESQAHLAAVITANPEVEKSLQRLRAAGEKLSSQIFNTNKSDYSLPQLFLGEQRNGLIDSLHTPYPELMREGSGMVEFSQQHPDRYFDVAIAEQHAVTFAAGLAIEGMKPVVAMYSSFTQRAYDQIIHDVAIQNLPVLFAIDRAGLVGADGPTHQGAFDISFLRTVPNMVIMTPSDENECRLMMAVDLSTDSIENVGVSNRRDSVGVCTTATGFAI